MTLPNFVIIGAAKCGTTSLYRILGQHPGIFTCPVKEPQYFALGDGGSVDRGAVRDLAEYESLFAGVRGEPAVGEASPQYFVSASAARRMRETIPDARLIAIVRDPAERAYSEYQMRVREGRENREVSAAFDAVLEELAADPAAAERRSYLLYGFYRLHLSRYEERFGSNALKIVLLEDLASDPLPLLRELFAFLGVDPDFRPEIGDRFNVGGVPRWQRVYRWADRQEWLKQRLPWRLGAVAKRSLLRAPQRLPSELRARLVELYRDDVRWLERRLDRDLGGWREV